LYARYGTRSGSCARFPVFLSLRWLPVLKFVFVRTDLDYFEGAIRQGEQNRRTPYVPLIEISKFSRRKASKAG
jgi:hypothetical protein